jgi:hypothetical protein
VNANELLYLSITGIHKLALDTNESTKVIDRNIERTPLSNYESAAVSPDAHWLAYTSRDSGREEVWVASYPSLNDHRPVSTLGGVSPVWTRRGSKTEIVYYHPVDDENGSLMSVAFVSEGSFPRPETLFTKSIREFAPGFAITPDGERILARVRDATGYPPPATIDVVFHFLDTLPAKLGGSR